MLFLNSWFFLAFSSIGILLVIYLLRKKHRPLIVSALFLWSTQIISGKGGKSIKSRRLPLAFYLEALILSLLVIAAAEPILLNHVSFPLLTIILDNSFSMKAGGEHSARMVAEQFLRNKLNKLPHKRFRLILAGSNIETRVETTSNKDKILKELQNWKCLATDSLLIKAIGIARNSYFERMDILVVTDHSPPSAINMDNIRWIAFGSPNQNCAFTNAVRSDIEDGSRYLFEIANFSSTPHHTVLTIKTEKSQTSEKIPLILKAGQIKRIRKTIKQDNIKVEAFLPADSLLADNHVKLLPELDQSLRVKLAFTEPEGKLGRIVKKAVKACNRVKLTSLLPDLIFTDKINNHPSEKQSWLCLFHNSGKAISRAEPFIMDKSHPLLTGISLEGVLWGCKKRTTLPGQSVIISGKTPLLSDYLTFNGNHILHFNFFPRFSTLQRSPAFPILIWNLITWCRSNLPGAEKKNVGNHQKIMINSRNAKQLIMQTPDGKKEKIPFIQDKIILEPLQSGIYKFITKPEKKSDAEKKSNEIFYVSVNLLSASESNLQRLKTGNWGNFTYLAYKTDNIGRPVWIFLLLALILLIVHLFFILK